MKISEHIVSNENGTEYFDIFFRISNPRDITLEQYKEIEDLIYKKLYDYERKVTPRYNSDIEF
jgi:hypothetical protein